MTSQPITLAAVRATRERCARLGLSPQRTRLATLTAIRAMDAGASPARAYADACSSIRESAPRSNGQPPRGAA